MSETTRFYVVLILGVLAISFGAIFIRLAQNESVPSLLIAASRLVIAAALVTPLTLSRHRAELKQVGRNDLLLAIFAGVALALHFAFWVSSLEYTSVLISVTLVTTTPIWTALFEVVFLKSGLRGTLVAGLAIVIIGGVLTSIEGGSGALEGSNLMLGAVLSLAGAVAFAAVLVIGRKLRATLSLLPYIWLIYGSGGIVLAIVILIQGIPVAGYAPVAYLWLFMSAAVPQLIGHSSLNYAVAHLSATYVSIATKLEPIGSAILAYFVFNEVPIMIQIIGSVVVLVGVLIASIERPARQTVTEATA